AVGLLAFVQFPWRFLGPASVFLAMLAGLGAIQLQAWLTSQFTIRNSQFIIFIIIFITALILLFALPWLFPSRAHSLPPDQSPADTIQFEVETGWLGTTAAADYLPRDVQSLPLADVTRSGLAATQLPEGLLVTEWVMDFTSLRFNYELDGTRTVTEPVEVVFHQFLFPGWRATLDGAALELAPSAPEGLITAVLPPGEHSFELTFGNTPLRTVATLISLISFVILLVLISYAVSRKPSSVHNSQFTIRNSQLIVFAVATVLLIFTLKTLLLDHINSPFRTTQLNAQLSAASPVNFGNVIQLLGADIPHEPVPADQEIDITLNWQALPPVTDEYSVSVQLMGENGRRVAQSDSFHPAGLPLPRWQAGEYGVDDHRLTALPATPPGDYRLVAFVYNLATGQRLDRLNEAGLPLDNEYELGRITLTTPSQFPQASDLTISHTNTEGGGTAPSLAENVQLLGYDAPLAEVTVGDVIPLTLYWYTPQTPAKDYETNIWISCASGKTVTSTGSVTVSPDAPDTTWQPGQLQRAEFDVPLRPVDEAGRPLRSGFCTLYLRLSAGEEANSIALETFTISVPERLFALPESAETVTEPVEVTVSADSGPITLAGFTLNQTSFAPGETMPLTLFWQTGEMVDIS
ncbi:MAG: hypothetical protein IAF02_27365, partial [Anaerolineae bacterium]|nr:hypothetical protein [Anaerolineae bacterium]